MLRWFTGRRASAVRFSSDSGASGAHPTQPRGSQGHLRGGAETRRLLGRGAQKSGEDAASEKHVQGLQEGNNCNGSQKVLQRANSYQEPTRTLDNRSFNDAILSCYTKDEE
ncbi:hypothetical protein TNIN_497311 [Trichonephila inaurata madagascariensis]|uniref:Uncharacterized protein n=1 Tax=Trichonephila inaurata madagascariensis TaxID=2747483 RepID=A0A8X6X885_9ARAC|nr:hypothetical protein TNIN_497311 [Trichonephila inaurata madagascariensis]